LSVPRAEAETLITTNGGKIAKTVSNKVDYLLSPPTETNSTKCLDAKALGVKLITEEWVKGCLLLPDQRSSKVREARYRPQGHFVKELIDFEDIEYLYRAELNHPSEEEWSGLFEAAGERGSPAASFVMKKFVLDT
jgi:hypothetical protein